MIVFDGYITGVAEQHLRKKDIMLGQKLAFWGGLVVLPVVIGMTILSNSWIIFWIYGALMALTPLLVRMPRTKKEKFQFTPKKIYIEDEYIVCVAEKYEETKRIEDVDIVYDYGEFYDVVFSFGRSSNNFICQKELIKHGKIDQFEKIFKDKLIKKHLK